MTYQGFFETSAEPMWRRVDRLRRAMGVLPYPQLEQDLRGRREAAHAGLLRVTVIDVLLAGATAIIVGAARWDGMPLFLGVLTVSGLVLLPTIVIAEAIKLSPGRCSPPLATPTWSSRPSSRS